VETMADLMHVSQTTVTRWENGSIDIPSSVLLRYCEHLGIPLAEIFAEDTPELPFHLRQLLASAKELTPSQVEQLSLFLETMTNKEK
jgi:transcriptional regulator with XRE-family HTH domain